MRTIIKVWHRPVNLRLLTVDTLLYRVFVVMEQGFVYWLIGQTTGLWGWKVSFGTSIIWNVVNMVTYFVWHYYLFHWFKVGRNGK